MQHFSLCVLWWGKAEVVGEDREGERGGRERKQEEGGGISGGKI